MRTSKVTMPTIGMTIAMAATTTSKAALYDVNLTLVESPAHFLMAELWARTTSPQDNIIGVSNARIYLSGMVPTWYNASLQPGDPIAGAAPLTGISYMLQPHMIADSFVTIGPDQTASSNTTVLEPAFDDSAFIKSGSIGPGVGWYNSDPTNGQGMPQQFFGAFGFVRLGRFSILWPEDIFGGVVPYVLITSLTVNYTTGPFGTDRQSWTLTSSIYFQYYVPSPPAALLFIAGAWTAPRRRRG